jgi:hypothetical protein
LITIVTEPVSRFPGSLKKMNDVFVGFGPVGKMSSRFQQMARTVIGGELGPPAVEPELERVLVPDPVLDPPPGSAPVPRPVPAGRPLFGPDDAPVLVPDDAPEPVAPDEPAPVPATGPAPLDAAVDDAPPKELFFAPEGVPPPPAQLAAARASPSAAAAIPNFRESNRIIATSHLTSYEGERIRRRSALSLTHHK